MSENSTIEITPPRGAAVPPKAVYLSAVRNQMPRLLGLQDRNPASPTYGCFDRNHWHYRVVDTPSARCQEAVLTLVLMHQSADPEFGGKDLLLEWANAGMEFWTRIQQTDGSFNEWYPNERSFVATAFSVHAVSESVLRMAKERVRSLRRVEEALIRAGRWLVRRPGGSALNQTSGAALALYDLFLLTGDRRFEAGAREKLAALRNGRSQEGWWPEYGGVDIGYLSLTISYLAKLYQKSGWEEVLDLAGPALGFLAHFVRPDGSAGGEFGSRLTEYLIPDGFEILAGRFPEAQRLREAARRALELGQGVSLSAYDDRYLTYVGYNYLEAFEAAGLDRTGQPDLEPRLAWRHFPESGLVLFSQPGFEGTVNWRRGGAFKFHFRGGRTASDGGLTLVAGDGSIHHAGYWDPAGRVQVSPGEIRIRGWLRKVRGSSLTPWANLAFRLFQLTVGRLGATGLRLKDALRRFLITPARTGTYEFERIVKMGEDGIQVEDRMIGGKPPAGSRFLIGSRGSFLYTPSSRFFNRTDLAEPPAIWCSPGVKSGRPAEIVRRFRPDGELSWEVSR